MVDSAAATSTTLATLAITGGRYDRLGEELHLSPHQIEIFLRFLVNLQNSSQLPIRLKHGCAKGTDRHIGRICSDRIVLDRYGLNIKVTQCPILPTDGDRFIGPKIRNIRMIRNSHPITELLVAFPGNGGTAHATNVALKIPIPVWKWTGSIYHGRLELVN